jgi:hypothetical protein
VEIPYELKPGENPNGIIVYHINSDGNLVLMRGHYIGGAVVFTTSHFSQFIVDYVQIPYTDIPNNWAKNAIEFTAARGFFVGITGDLFEPGRAATRGEFLAALMNAYGILPDESATDNFADVDDDKAYAAHVATAKMLGISLGVGNNLFEPEKQITREEMFALLYRSLVNIGEAPQKARDGKTLDDFTDSDAIASWASDEIEALLQANLIEGTSDSTLELSPKGRSDRAMMAEMLYRLLTR